MKNRILWIKMLVCVLPFIIVGLVYLFRDVLINIGTIFPACPSYTYLDIYCPGCGNTRSVLHLLKGDVVGSLRFNIVPIFGIVIVALAYIELITLVFRNHIKIIPRSRKFWILVVMFFSVYFIVRNYVRLF